MFPDSVFTNQYGRDIVVRLHGVVKALSGIAGFVEIRDQHDALQLLDWPRWCRPPPRQNCRRTGENVADSLMSASEIDRRNCRHHGEASWRNAKPRHSRLTGKAGRNVKMLPTRCGHASGHCCALCHQRCDRRYPGGRSNHRQTSWVRSSIQRSRRGRPRGAEARSRRRSASLWWSVGFGRRGEGIVPPRAPSSRSVSGGSRSERVTGWGQLLGRARSSAQRERACRWGSPAAASSRTARRSSLRKPLVAAITAGSSSHAASMTAGPARRTSRTATSDGVNAWSSRPTGRCVKRTPGHGVGARVGTAARYVEGTWDVRPNQYAAATPAGPEPGPPSAKATSSTRGGDMPIVVIAPFQ